MRDGLLQVADTLHFLHSEAGLVHKGLCPASLLITQSGAHHGPVAALPKAALWCAAHLGLVQSGTCISGNCW